MTEPESPPPRPQPLRGQRIVVTRDASGAKALGEELERLGARPILFPVIELVPLPTNELAAAIENWESVDWVVLTSGNAVRFFFRYLESRRRSLSWPKVAAVGSATARLLEETYHVSVEHVPAKFTGEQLVAGMGDLTGQRVLLPRSRIGRPEVVEMLHARGAEVTEIPIYDTIQATPGPEVLAALRDGVDVITFASPSGVRNFLQIVEKEGVPRETVTGARIACIGPTTAQAAQEQGLVVDIMPDTHTTDGLLSALCTHAQVTGRRAARPSGRPPGQSR